MINWWIVTGFNLRETSWDFEEIECYLNIESFFLYFYFFRVAFSVYLKCYFRGEWFLLLTCFGADIYINMFVTEQARLWLWKLCCQQLAALREIQFVSIIDEGTAKQEFGFLFAYAAWVQEWQSLKENVRT